MKEIVQNLNKRSIADGTGISYSRLRKYSAGEIQQLRDEEVDAIQAYLLELAKKIQIYKENAK